MKKGDIIELIIEDIGANGEGIGRYLGNTVFVPFALDGEKVTAQIVHIKNNLIFTKLKSIISKSPLRVSPVCPLFIKCGGCDYLHLDYESQLYYKKQNLVNIMKKNAGYEGDIKDIVPSKNHLYYRNKIQLPFGYADGNIVLGFYKENSHEVVPLTKCYLHEDWADRLIAIILDYAKSNRLSVYNEKTGKGLLRHLVARFLKGSLSVTLVINGKALPNINKLTNALKKEFINVSLYISVNTLKNNVIMGKEIIEVLPPPSPTNIMGVDININPLSFFQVNDEIFEKIYKDIKTIVKPNPNTIFIDAFSGVGLLGAILAKDGASVFNIEIVPEAVEDGKNLYNMNNIKGVHILGDAAVELPKLLSTIFNGNDEKAKENNLNKQGDKASSKNKREKKELFIFLDPPRKGVDKRVIDAIKALTKSYHFTLIYLSCNPATLSRDLALFATPKVSLSPTHIQPYDMFPNTKHVECVVLMSRENKDWSFHYE